MTVCLPADWDRNRIVPLVLDALALATMSIALLCLLAAAPVFAAKDHCRDISFEGVAGQGSQDIVSFTVLGCDGNIVHESCAMQINAGEEDVELLQRLPFYWGELDFMNANPSDPSNKTCNLPPEPDPLPKKVCVNSLNGPSCNPTTGEGCHSCKLKLKLKQKSDGTYKKKHVQVCCYENADCKKKLGKIDADAIPVTIQAEKNFTEVCPPDEEACAESPSSCTINLDPMGVKQFPGEAAKKCRGSLGKEVALYARTVLDSLVKCHAVSLKAGALDPSCNDPSLDPTGIIAAAEARLSAKIAKGCPVGSPWRLGYRSCHAPCDTIDILTCSAGANIGSPCSTDRDCDTAPGARDGQCGDWSQVAACMTCEAQAAVGQAMTDEFGTSAVTMSQEAAECQNAIGRALSSLVRAHLAETASCQKKLDSAKLVLPASAPSCTQEDIKNKRAKAEAVAADTITKACSAALLSELNPICSGASTVADVISCVQADARTLNDVSSAIAFPETRGGGSAAPSGTCPGSARLILSAGGGAPCHGDPDCIPGKCINGTCRTPTDFDFGWSGTAHDQDLPDKGRLGLALSCSASQAPCGSCTIAGIDPVQGNCRCSNDSSVVCTQPFATDPICGGGTCQCYASNPTAIVAGGTPACYLPVLGAPPAGSIDVDTGDAALSLPLFGQLYIGGSTAQPCPVCNGDTTPGDGIQDGTCTDGPRVGLPCDVTARDYTFGAVSLDCLPNPANNISGQGLRTALDLTTGTATLASSVPCVSAPGLCACGSCSLDSSFACSNNADCGAAGPCQAAMPQPNSCQGFACTMGTDGDGTCDAGPVDMFCDGFVRANGAGIVPCFTNVDCGSSGNCSLIKPRECFPDPILASGIASPGYPVLAGAACVPPAGSGAINAAVGLVGPEKLRLQTRATFFCSSNPTQTYEPGTGGCP